MLLRPAESRVFLRMRSSSLLVVIVKNLLRVPMFRELHRENPKTVYPEMHRKGDILLAAQSRLLRAFLVFRGPDLYLLVHRPPKREPPKFLIHNLV